MRTLVVLTILFIIFQRRRERLVSLVIGLPVMASTWAHYIVADSFETALEASHHGFPVAFLTFAVAVILRGILAQGVVPG